jgi:hypothetical protein
MQTNRLTLRDAGGLDIFVLLAKALAPASADFYGSASPVPAPTGPALAKVRRRGLLERIGHWLAAQQRRDIEAYLARSADVYDLEARIRKIDRNGFHPYY